MSKFYFFNILQQHYLMSETTQIHYLLSFSFHCYYLLFICTVGSPLVMCVMQLMFAFSGKGCTAETKIKIF